MLATLDPSKSVISLAACLQHIFPCGPSYPPNTANAESIGTHSCAGTLRSLSGEMR